MSFSIDKQWKSKLMHRTFLFWLSIYLNILYFDSTAESGNLKSTNEHQRQRFLTLIYVNVMSESITEPIGCTHFSYQYLLYSVWEKHNSHCMTWSPKTWAIKNKHESCSEDVLMGTLVPFLWNQSEFTFGNCFMISGKHICLFVQLHHKHLS